MVVMLRSRLTWCGRFEVSNDLGASTWPAQAIVGDCKGGFEVGQAKLTEFGRTLPKAQREQALALAGVAVRLKAVGAKLYPGIPCQKWTLDMWDAIYSEAEKEWEDDQR